MQKNSSQAKKVPCLKVEKTLGEKAITALKANGIFGVDYKIDHQENFLFLPLKRKPNKIELEKLKKEVTNFAVVVHKVPRRIESRLNPADLLAEKLPPYLQASLPQAVDFIGDIAVIEIPPELCNYKAVIGDAILKTHKRVSTVLAKSSPVEGEFRVGKFEPIAGVAKTSTVHREYGCVFYVDLAKAYFSPRLSYEHNRIASLVKENETVLDMFTGVGPFAIHIAKKRHNVHVYAVDKNPEAIRLLKKNIIANRVETKITPMLGDAREIVAEKLRGLADGVIMNLPERAIKYVDMACQAIRPEGGIVHYYEFTSETDAVKAAEERLKQAVKQNDRKVDEIFSSRIVRGTAPFTWQVVVDALVK